MVRKRPGLLIEDSIWVRFLMEIPRVTMVKAKAIAKVYQSLKTFTRAIEASGRDLNLITNLEYSQGKKIGKALSKSIIEFLIS